MTTIDPHASWMIFIRPIMEELDAELRNFQWAFPDRSENRGEIQVDWESGQLVMVVWCRDNDDPSNEEVKPLRVSRGITTQEPRQQIRSLIHEYLCHEADEQIWFGNERPFYPHPQSRLRQPIRQPALDRVYRYRRPYHCRGNVGV